MMNQEKIDLIPSTESKADSDPMTSHTTDPLFSDDDSSATPSLKIDSANEAPKKFKIIKKKPVKVNHQSISKMPRCILCNATTEGKFCARCVSAGFRDQHEADPESVCKGIWQKNASSEWVFMKYRKRKNPINKLSANNSDMDILYKFHLLRFSKNPTAMWRGAKKPGVKGRGWSKGYTANDSNNIGIPCGKVNGIIAIDLDFQTIKDDSGKKIGIDREWHQRQDIPFHQEFGLPFNEGDTDEAAAGYIYKWDTLTQATANGGVHMIFKYDPDVPSSHNHPAIDIQSDGYYIVGMGSKVYDFDKQLQEYKIIHNASIKPMPDDLREWVLDNCYTKSQKQARTSRKKKLAAADADINYYTYEMSNEVAEQFSADLKTADPEYFTDTKKWCCYTTAMKVVNKKEIWDKWSQGGDKYDADRNEKFWQWSKDKEFAAVLYKIFTVISRVNPIWKGYMDLVKMKPIYSYNLDYNINIPAESGKYLGLAMDCDASSDYLLHSSTGTGKTTLIKNLYKNTGARFISITSRKSLAYEQYRVFENAGIRKMVYYGNYMDDPSDQFPRNKNVCIQIDSIDKIRYYLPDIKHYDIFLDEYSSLIEYLITSDTLRTKRIPIFRRLIQIIRGCRRVIGADADINSYTMRFLTWCGRKPILVKNNYEMATGRPAVEHFSLESFKKKLLTEDKFILATDSKTCALSVFHTWLKLKPLPLDDDDNYTYKGKKIPKYELLLGQDDKGVVICLTGNNPGTTDLDDFDRVIFSPKIVYGLDSTMERPVYCQYEEGIITPKAMLQQVARCRNPTELNFLFTKKKFSYPGYLDIKETDADLLKVENRYDDWELMADQGEINLFKDIIKFIIYNDDCYNTNPYLHFIKMSKQRGWDIQTGMMATSGKGLQLLKKQYKVLETTELFDTQHPILKEKNEYIGVDEDDMSDLTTDQKLVFTRATDYDYYIALKYYLLKNDDDIHNDIATQDDFKVSRMRQVRGLITLLRAYIDLTGCPSKIDLTCQRGIPEGQKTSTLLAVINQGRCRFKRDRYDISKVKDAQEVLFKLVKQTLGPKSIKSKRQMIDGVRQQVYEINTDWMAEMYSMIEIKNKIVPFSEGDWRIGHEHSNWRKEEPGLPIDSEEECDDI